MPLNTFVSNRTSYTFTLGGLAPNPVAIYTAQYFRSLQNESCLTS